MRYEHEVSESWLRARQRYLTASDVVRLIPEARRIDSGKLRLEEARAFARVYGEKQDRYPDTRAPSSAAARGHVLEPYAVEQFNRLSGTQFCHWDDFVIARGNIAFSPDALDIDQPRGVKAIAVDDSLSTIDGKVDGPTHLLECKCYEAGSHYQRRLDVMCGRDVDERWQVAMAMVVCPTIMHGSIIWFAPQCDDSFYRDYDRDDIEDEIEVVESVADMWSVFCGLMEGSAKPFVFESYISEEAIYQQYLAERALDVM